jgi:ketosteroid isomerase-like protein
MTRRLAPLLALLLGASACASARPTRIPGTDIRSTPENRAVYAVVESYVDALNRRDPAAVLAHVAPDYFDDAGTPDPADDLDRARLEQVLAEDLARIEALKLAVTLRKIEVEGDTAFAEIFYDTYYRVQTPSGPVPRRDSDIHRLRLRNVGGEWKIVAGL